MPNNETIAQALAKTKQQIAEAPADPALILIESQLNYIRKVLSGKRPYKFRLSRINLNDLSKLNAAKQDESYSNLLAQSQKIADSFRH